MSQKRSFLRQNCNYDQGQAERVRAAYSPAEYERLAALKNKAVAGAAEQQVTLTAIGTFATGIPGAAEIVTHDPETQSREWFPWRNWTGGWS